MPIRSPATRPKRAAPNAHEKHSAAQNAQERQRAADELSTRPEAQPPEFYAGSPSTPHTAPSNQFAATGRAPIYPASSGSSGMGGRGNAEPGFEVRGYATDPKHSGYQILTNYESTYWRAFVGVQAWALYEVLRSFCHNGNNVCYPSINYLLEVLGIKQRRVLTGWSTEVKGKQYDYPGLIEILQNGGLIIAEMTGEGPMQRYLFHVNLTPDLLHPEQVAELPALLQSKHAELLQTHFEEMAELASRRRPAKTPNAPQNITPPDAPPPSSQQSQAALNTVPKTASKLVGKSSNEPPFQPPMSEPPPNFLQNEDFSTTNMVETGGMTNCQTPMTNCHTPSDNLSPKQHQYNNTQLTNISTTKLVDNNSGDLQQELQTDALDPNESTNSENIDVVVTLTQLGLADSVVNRLTTRFNRNRILEKIDYLAYLEECHPNKVKNPRGWLRRAIEENYGAPDGYLNAQARAAQRKLSPYSQYNIWQTTPDSQPIVDSSLDQEGLDRGEEANEARQDALPIDPRPIDALPDPLPNTHQPSASTPPQTDPNRGPADNSYRHQPTLFAGDDRAERDYLRTTRRERIRQQYAPDNATLAFWELVQNDVRLTMPAEHYRLIADAQVLWMDHETVAIATWDRAIYIELLHPHRAKALERTMQMLAFHHRPRGEAGQYKLKLVCEYWDEEGQVVPPGAYPPPR